MVLAIKSKNIRFLLKALVILLSTVLMGTAFFMAYRVSEYVVAFRSSGSVVKTVLETEPSLDNYMPLSEHLTGDMYTLFEMTGDREEDEDYEDYYYDLPADLKYYVVNHKTGKELTNFSKTEQAALDDGSLLPTISVKDGVPSYGDEAFDGVLDRYRDGGTGKLLLDCTEQCDYVLVIDTAYSSYDSNSYAAVLDNYYLLASVPAEQEFIIGLVLGIAALLLAAAAFVFAGEKQENGKVKRMWLDYIPTDIHLVLTVAGQVGVCLLAGYAMDSFYYSLSYDSKVACGLLAAAGAGVFWLLLIEFVTSFIRVCKSDKGLWNNLFAVVLVKVCIVKPVKAVIGALRYQPNCFKKQLKTFLLLYGGVNVVLVLLDFIAVTSNFREFLFIVLLLMIAGNIACLILLLQYAEKLDKIIIAAHYRTVPQVDYNTLPNSLKILCSSLQVTRQELDTAVTRAVRDERLRTELITNVSHDLKTPLTSIISYVDLLKQCDIADDNAKEYINILDEKSERLKHLIDDLMEASKITSGVVQLHPTALSLNELAVQAIGERQQEFADSDLELIFKGDKAPVICYADGDKTFRVLDNLLSNARKYSAAGTRVYCDVYETPQFSAFEIKNTSAQPLDISPQELTERFVRGDRSRNTEGSGLGLSIAENLCRLQNGRLVIVIDGDLFKAQVLLPKKP